MQDTRPLYAEYEEKPRSLLKNAGWVVLAAFVAWGTFAAAQRTREHSHLADIAASAKQLRLVVTEFYQSQNRLPQAWDAEALGKNAGLWPGMTVVAPGVLRHEMPNGTRAVYQVFTESKSAQFGLTSRCVVSDASLVGRMALRNLQCAEDPAWLAQLGTAAATAVAAAPKAAASGPVAAAMPQVLFEQYFDAGRAQRIATCLAPWPVKWRLPYFPNLASGQCDTQAASGPGGIRKTTVSLSHRPNWFVAQGARNEGRFASAPAMAAHFEALLTTQGFTRAASVENEEASDGMPPNAVYTRGQGADALRINLRYTLDSTVLSIEGVEPASAGAAAAAKATAPAAAAATLAGAQLPRPAAMHSLYESGHFGPWFALPGLKLTHDGAGGGNALIVPLAKIDTQRFITPDWQDVQRSGGSGTEEALYLFEFARRLLYKAQPAIPRAELLAAYRAALVGAGWTLGAERPSEGHDSLQAHFKFPDRTITVRVEVHDPSFVQQVYVIGNSITQRRGYNFTPQLSGNPKAVEQTKLQLDVMDYYLRSEMDRAPANKNSGVLLRPALVQGQENDPAKLAEAKAMAQSLVAEFKRRGWAEDRIRVIDKRNANTIRPSGPFTHGVRVSTYNCNTSESRGAAGEQNCVCRAGSPEVIDATPGACK
jgi:hypothetical protein